NIELVTGDLEERGGSHLPTGEMQFCIVANLLWGISNKNALVEEVWRVLTEQGTRTEAGRALIIDWKGSFNGLGPHADHIVSESAAHTLFEQSGFEYLHAIDAGEYHWGF